MRRGGRLQEVVETGPAQAVAHKSFCLVYPHTLNLLEQETGTIGVLTPSCSFDDDEEDDDEAATAAGTTLLLLLLPPPTTTTTMSTLARAGAFSIQKPIGSFSLTTVNACIYQTKHIQRFTLLVH